MGEFMKRNALRLADLIGYSLVVYGPSACINPFTRFGEWCLDHAGGHAYRDYRELP